MTTSGSVNIPPSFRLVDIGEKAFKKLTIDNPRALSPEVLPDLISHRAGRMEACYPRIFKPRGNLVSRSTPWAVTTHMSPMHAACLSSPN